MYEIALGLSIVSSVLLIAYLLSLICGARRKDNDLTITISGRIITTTVTQTCRDDKSGILNVGCGSQARSLIDGVLTNPEVLQSRIK